MAMPTFDRSKLFKVKSHARAYLKAILKGKEAFDEALVLQLFRLHYTVNACKQAIIHQPHATVKIVRADGNKCFEINGARVSTKLDKPTDHCLVAQACRTSIESDIPDKLKAQRCPGIELDHANSGGFAQIVSEFEKAYNASTIVKEMLTKQPGTSRWTLKDPLRTAFLLLHRQRTNNWELVQPLTHRQHLEISKKRKRGDNSVDDSSVVTE
jgi:hypothetical protein